MIIILKNSIPSLKVAVVIMKLVVTTWVFCPSHFNLMLA